MTRNLTMKLKGNSASEFTRLTTNELTSLLGKQQQFHNATNLVALKQSPIGLTLPDAVMPLAASDGCADADNNSDILSGELTLKTFDLNRPSSQARLGRDADTGARMVSGRAEKG